MRLINVRTFDFEDHQPHEVRYAILSHKWVDGREIMFRDFDNPMKVDKSLLPRLDRLPAGEKSFGVAKIAWSAAIARSRGLDYIWIDTCCIDKTSSAELDESINSMYQWYRTAVECYAYLLDVSGGFTEEKFSGSVIVRFYDRGWNFMSTKTDLAVEISRATNIDQAYLGGSFEDASIATRMSWVSKRTTTKPEDMTYCLLGIFGVSMNIRYGGNNDAFLRLQKKLLKQYNDDSILAWTSTDPKLTTSGLLAPEPACFRDSANITNVSTKYKRRPPIEWTTAGVQITVPVFFWDVQNGREWNDLYVTSWRTREVALNCWKVGADKRQDTVSVHLKKTKQKGWQRDQCGELGSMRGWKIHDCYDFVGNPKSRSVTIRQ
ncbi:MAG: hypothetical protein Q9222_002635 [Ikaeria aurantiellina]